MEVQATYTLLTQDQVNAVSAMIHISFHERWHEFGVIPSVHHLIHQPID